jgi:hypothetical protein
MTDILQLKYFASANLNAVQRRSDIKSAGLVQVWLAIAQDLRIQCRQRGLSPAGGKEELTERLKEHMMKTQDLCASRSPALSNSSVL